MFDKSRAKLTWLLFSPKFSNLVKTHKIRTIRRVLKNLPEEQKMKLLSTPNSDGYTPLLLAARECQPASDAQTIRALLEGLTPEQQLTLLGHKDNSGDTPLFWAAFETPDAIQALLQNLPQNSVLAALKQGNNEGKTPLMRAVESNFNQESAKKTITAMLVSLTPEQKQELFNQTDTADQQTAIMWARAQQKTEIVAFLQELGARLPDEDIYDINGKQSTHTASVENALTRSAIGLAARYLKISKEDKDILKAWAKGDVAQEQDAKNYTAALAVIQRTDTQQILSDLTIQYKIKIDSWIEKYIETKDQERLLKRSVKRIYTITNPDFNKIQSGLTPSQALALVCEGIRDKRMFRKKGDTPTDLEIKLKSRRQILMQNLCEIQTEYGKYADGTDHPACAGGTFNKLISTLAGGLHKDVKMVFVNEGTVKAKTMALVAELFKTGNTQEELEALNKDEHFMLLFNLPEPVRFSLQKKISAKLHEEFDAFVTDGLLFTFIENNVLCNGDIKDIDKASEKGLHLLDADTTRLISQKLAAYQAVCANR